MISYFPIVTGSLTVSGSITATGNIVGTATSASYASTAVTASYALSSNSTLQTVLNSGNGASNYGGGTAATIQLTNFTNGRTLYINDNSYPTIRMVDNSDASNNLQIDLNTLSLDGTSYNWSDIVNSTSSYADNFTVAGTLTAQTLVVQTITSSVDFVTGSTRFGSLSSNTHIFTGSMSVSGGLFDINKDGQALRIFPLTSSGSARIQLQSSGSAGLAGANSIIAVESVNGGDNFTNSQPYSLTIGTATQKAFHLGTNSVVVMTITGSSVGIGTTNLTTEAKLSLGAEGASEGGQLILQKGTSYASASHIDNYQDQFRIMSGTDTSSTTVRMAINMTNGAVTIPGQPAFRAGRSTSYAPGINTTIVFDSTGGFGFNVGGHYSTSTGRFTAPVTGIYNFTACVIWESLSNGQFMDDAFTVRVNGSLAAYSFKRGVYSTNVTGTGGYHTDFATVLLNLTAGQYVEIYNYRNLTVHGNENYCYFTGYLVS
jgi:hypothetical protein